MKNGRHLVYSNDEFGDSDNGVTAKMWQAGVCREAFEVHSDAAGAFVPA